MKKKLLIAMACLAVIAVFFVTILLPNKITPVSDSDLAFVRANVSSNENAFSILEEAAEELSWPDNANRIKEIIEWESWDANFVTQTLNKNHKALELLDKGLLCPRLQVPEIATYLEKFNYLESWRRLSQLAVIRSIALFHEGKTKAAFDSAIQIAHLGNDMEGSDGVLLHYLIGSAVKIMSLRSLQQMTAASSMPCDLMRSYSEELNQLYANEAALTNVFKMEYQLQSKHVDDWASSAAVGNTNEPGILGRRLFDPEETRGIYAQSARTGLKSIRPHYNHLPTTPVVFSTNRSIFKFFFSRNAIGQTLSQMSLPTEKVMFQKCRENINVAATQIILALKCYKEKYGALPSSLEQLVPEFLPKIPVDDFDGKPLRYSVEKKVIYSVGEDLIDSGSEEKDAAKKPLDIPFEVEF